jgi:hypothetical protein
MANVIWASATVALGHVVVWCLLNRVRMRGDKIRRVFIGMLWRWSMVIWMRWKFLREWGSEAIISRSIRVVAAAMELGRIHTGIVCPRSIAQRPI